MTDYEKIYSGLKKSEDFEKKEWFKPSEGINKIKLLSEMSEQYITLFKEKEIPKVRFDIEFGKKQYVWSVTVGQTENSLYGQLVKLGKKLGSLVNAEITLVVKGKDKSTTYTILELLDEKEKSKQEYAEQELQNVKSDTEDKEKVIFDARDHPENYKSEDKDEDKVDTKTEEK